MYRGKMNMLSPLKKWVIGSFLFLIVLTTSIYLFFIHEIDHMLGGNTQVVDVSQFKPLSGPFAVHNVQVLSVDSQLMQENQTILINGKKIEYVGSHEAIPNRDWVLKNYQQIDGGGRFVIPGLIDSHVHVKKSKNDLLLYLANGVTQIGEMTGMSQHFDYLDEINNHGVGPQMFIASPKINSRTDIGAMFRSAFEKRHKSFVTPNQIKKAIQQYKAAGYQAIKLSSDLNREIYYEINSEAKRQRMVVIGHLPVGLQMSDLYASGQTQLAHIDSITHNLMNEFGGLSSSNYEAFLAHIRESADSIAINLKKNNITIASTVWLHQTRPLQDFDLARFLNSIQLVYQNPGWLEGSFVSRGCLPSENSYENPHNTDEQSINEWRIFYQSYNQAIKLITQALVRHEVTITAGTDALGACGMIAGFSLHEELQALNGLGLTPSQVLQTATVSAADWMGVRTGKIAANYRADLVLLENNPLEDIANINTINAVIANGNYWNRSELDAMLEAVKQANNNSRRKQIDEYLIEPKG